MTALPLVIAALALVAAVYLGLGGRAIFGHHEHPAMLTGISLALSSFDSTNLTDREEIHATVVGHDGKAYVLETDLGRLICAARHKGYPLSLLARSKRKQIAVSVWDKEGKGDIALAKRAI